MFRATAEETKLTERLFHFALVRRLAATNSRSQESLWLALTKAQSAYLSDELVIWEFMKPLLHKKSKAEKSYGDNTLSRCVVVSATEQLIGLTSFGFSILLYNILHMTTF